MNTALETVYIPLAKAMMADIEKTKETILTHIQMTTDEDVFEDAKKLIDKHINITATQRSYAEALQQVYTLDEAQQIMEMTTHPGWLVYKSKLDLVALLQMQQMTQLMTAVMNDIVKMTDNED